MDRCSTSGDPFRKGISQHAVLSALDRLPIEHRVAVVLVDVQGLDCQEAADILALPPQRVTQILEQGRRLIEKELYPVSPRNDLRHRPAISRSKRILEVKSGIKAAVDTISISPNLLESIVSRIRYVPYGTSNLRGKKSTHRGSLAEKSGVLLVVLLFKIADAVLQSA